LAAHCREVADQIDWLGHAHVAAHGDRPVDDLDAHLWMTVAPEDEPIAHQRPRELLRWAVILEQIAGRAQNLAVALVAHLAQRARTPAHAQDGRLPVAQRQEVIDPALQHLGRLGVAAPAMQDGAA